MPLTLDALQLVDAIARRGSFAGAAAERDAIARGELIMLTTEHGRSDAGHSIACLAWRADARGMALDWSIEELAKPAVRAVLLA
jgi:hypothetical protein